MSDVRPWEFVVAEDLGRLRQLQLYRQPRIMRPIDATHVECEGRTLVNFSSNNYLGLTHHPRILGAVEQAIARDGFGSAAAPLITGYTPAHDSAERALAAWKGAEAAVFLPSGYQANLAAIQTLAAIGERTNGERPEARRSGGVRFLVDKLAHASLIDAIRGSGAAFRVFPHNHMAKLKRLLSGSDAGVLQVVVTESIFSMDGDAADLTGIARLKEEHKFLLLLDEAHASGVYGPAGAGLAAELRLGQMVDVSILTLSKALGGIGGAVCGSAVFCDALVNYGRAYLFSTALPAAVAAAGEAAITVLREDPSRQMRVRELARHVREKLGQTPFVMPSGDSPIVPIILGEEGHTLRAARELFEKGLLVVAVRPPTVPRGSSRLRITLCSQHSDEEVERLIAAIQYLA
jgi:8-amino-7-oxononanoate synthase